METLKFIITSDTYPPYSNGGDANHVLLLSNELAEKGHEVHVISNYNAYSLLAKRFNWKFEKLEEKQNNNNIHSYSLDSPYGNLEPALTYIFGKSSFYSTKYEQILKQVKPDVVHHHDVTFLGHDFFKKRGNYIQFYTSHNYWLVCPNRELLKFGKFCSKPSFCSFCLLHSKRVPQVWRWKTNIERVVKDLDQIIGPSEYLSKKLEIKLKKNIIHLPNFIPDFNKDIKSSGYKNYFLYVGQLTERKGIMNLLNTFKKHYHEINANLIIVGSGSIEFKIKDFIKNNRLEKKVLLLGRVDNDLLLSLYKDATATVVPSIWPENNPLVALESMSLGTPVIGTDVGGLGEIIRKVDKNLIFKRDGLEEIRLILNNRSIYSKEKIKKVYNQWYSPDKYLKEYMKLIRGKYRDGQL